MLFFSFFYYQKKKKNKLFLSPRHVSPFPFKRPSPIHLLSDVLSFRDTVNSVGLIPRRLPFTTSNTVVNTFRHAVSLDERRAKFKANLWNRPQKKEELLSISDQKVAEETKKKDKNNEQHHHHHESLRMLENKYEKCRATPTDVDEVTIFYLFDYCFKDLRSFFFFNINIKVWFIGCHCGNGFSVYLV